MNPKNGVAAPRAEAKPAPEQSSQSAARSTVGNPTNPGNSWEANARALKARKLIDAIDGVLPHIYARTPEMALGAVEGLGDAGWQTAANVAGVNLPSLETREIVLSTFRRRVQASVDAALARAIAGALARAS